MPLTPQEVAGKVFGPTRMRRGYDEHEVDAFLDEVEAELTRLTTENEQLRKDLEKAGGVASTAAESGSSSAPAEAASVEAPAAAPVQAIAPVEEAPVEQRVTRMIVLAQQTADAALREAQGEADRTRGTARAEAERMLAEARSRVAEELGGLERSKARLESEVGELTAFEQEYRQRLRVFLEGRLQDLDTSLAGIGVVAGRGGKHALDSGLADPPGFGAIWSPQEGGYSGGASVSNGAEVGSSSFDAGSEGSHNGG
jgi:DivIVA domain-containing protein